MTLTINRSVAKGKISAPPSKSMAHRLLISAALCGEKCCLFQGYRGDRFLS